MVAEAVVDMYHYEYVNDIRYTLKSSDNAFLKNQRFIRY